MRENGVNGKGERTAEDVVCFWTEKKKKRGEEEYNVSARHGGGGHVAAGGDTARGKEDVALSLILK